MSEIIIKDTHRGLWYEDGKLTRVLEAGRYQLPARWRRALRLAPHVEVILVDMRDRDLTIKGQEILTSDKVAIRVSIAVQYRVIDATAALHKVESYADRIYSDAQLAARRSLASMTLEDILTNRTRLSEDILRDVKEIAATYGVEILRADVKDLVFPGNLQEIMNRVLAAERMSEAQLVEARTKAEVQRIDAESKAATRRLEQTAQAAIERETAQNEADIQRIRTEAEVRALQERAQHAALFEQHPAIMRLLELEALQTLAAAANARIYVNFDRPANDKADSKDD